MFTAARSGTDPIRSLLRPGERTLWRGQPDPAAYSLSGSWFLFPFSIVWCAFAIAWEVSVVVSDAGPMFILWGIPFVLLGLYMVLGRFLVARAEARGTHYVITDQRVLIVIGGLRRRVVQMALEDVPPAQVELGRNGKGTLTLGTASIPLRLPPAWPMGGMYPQPHAFSSILDPEAAYRVLQQAKSEAWRRVP